jgi:hypothetical protein
MWKGEGEWKKKLDLDEMKKSKHETQRVMSYMQKLFKESGIEWQRL